MLMPIRSQTSIIIVFPDLAMLCKAMSNLRFFADEQYFLTEEI